MDSTSSEETLYISAFKFLFLDVVCYCTFVSAVITCSELPLPENGVVSYSNEARLPTTVATYSCNPGSSLNGRSTRTCQSNRTWSGSAPTCEGEG